MKIIRVNKLHNKTCRISYDEIKQAMVAHLDIVVEYKNQHMELTWGYLVGHFRGYTPFFKNSYFNFVFKDNLPEYKKEIIAKLKRSYCI